MTNPSSSDPTTQDYVPAPQDGPPTVSSTGSVSGGYSSTAQPSFSSDLPQTGGYSTEGLSGSSDDRSTRDVARDEAASVKDTAVGATQQVAGVAKQEVGNVASEAGYQAKNLVNQALGEVRSQAGQQQQRLAEGVHSVSKQLGSMASSSDAPGPLADLAQQAAAKGGELAHWLENREPSDLLEELKSFARRRPVAFLLGAALAGVVAGRLTRGLTANASDQKALESTPTRALTTQPQPTTYAPPPPPASLMDDVSGQQTSATYDRQDDILPDSSYVSGSGFPATGRDDVTR